MELDDQTIRHFTAWANRSVRPEEHTCVFDKIMTLLRDDPELLDNHTWTELRDLANAW